ncbi:MAG TPA: SPFH domain-containing protein [Methylomirabilota bacterium]|nr:SPFH domain-containing protein [Methylomirabilota bacterium]
MRESAARSSSGMFMLLLIPVLLILSVWWLVQSIQHSSTFQVLGAVFAIAVLSISLGGFFVVEPNQSTVLMLFGNYRGSERRPGLWWANPFMTKKRVTMRVRNFESSKLKVNDHDGNPIEIGAVVVWRVVDSAEAIFQVDNYDNFVHVQSEAALRNLATGHPYDAHNDGQMSLRGNTLEIADLLKGEIQERLEKAGVQVMEARISHLAYAPEIANAMLRRQQASAVIAARTKIVEGAVSMVEMALDELAKRSVVTLDEERKAAMVSNLLVVLCSEHETQPIVNAGTLYQG